MVVLVEASQQTDVDKCQRIWGVLTELYVVNSSLSDVGEDRRRLHAAELIVAAWKTCQSRGTVDPPPAKLELVANLERKLAEYTAESTVPTNIGATEESEVGDFTGMETPRSLAPLEQDANALFDLDFEDIDWSFWNSID